MLGRYQKDGSAALNGRIRIREAIGGDALVAIGECSALRCDALGCDAIHNGMRSWEVRFDRRTAKILPIGRHYELSSLIFSSPSFLPVSGECL